MKKLLLTVSIVGLSALFIFSSTSLFARSGKSVGKGLGDLPVKLLVEYADDIGLSDTQLDDIIRIHDTSKKEMIQLQADMKILHIDLKSEMDNDRPDRKKLSSLLDKVNQIEGQLKKDKIMSILDVKDILTPEQTGKIKEIVREKRMERRDLRMEKMRDRREYRQTHHENIHEPPID